MRNRLGRDKTGPNGMDMFRNGCGWLGKKMFGLWGRRHST